MKKFFKSSIVTVVVAFFVFAVLSFVAPNTALAASAPVLGVASSFAVLAGSGIVSTNPPQVIIGDAGSNPTVSNGLTGVQVTGTNYTAADAAVIAAKVAAGLAYANAAAQLQSGADIPTDLAAQTLTAGVYHAASGTFTISGAGTLTLNGGGNPNAVFIFKADTTLITGGASSVVLTNGAQARNVFWTVGTSATLNNTTFVGTIMAEASITDSGNSTVVGRLLADAENNGTGAVTLNNTHVTVPTNLTLSKSVSGGGGSVATAWNLSTVAPSPTLVSGATGSVAVTNAAVLPGSYTLSESALPAGYTPSLYSCVKNGLPAVASNTIILAAGDEATCTITNAFIPPVVVPSPSYSPVVPPLIDVVKVPTPLSLPAGPGSVNYTYTLTNIGTVPVTNITMTDDSCSPLTLTSGDTNADSKLDLTETWIYHCSTTLSATHTNTVTATGWANGISAVDLASATVVVGVPTVPPLIHITKVPNPLTLGAGGGMVTYTKKVTNPGTVALSNVHVTDTKCSPINYISGDTNGDSKLDPTETWTYTCQINLTSTTTNTAIATGTANGLTATDFAIATVVVASPVVYTVPTLPNTGVAPSGNILIWLVVIAGIFAVLLIIYFIRRKQLE